MRFDCKSGDDNDGDDEDLIVRGGNSRSLRMINILISAKYTPKMELGVEHY